MGAEELTPFNVIVIKLNGLERISLMPSGFFRKFWGKDKVGGIKEWSPYFRKHAFKGITLNITLKDSYSQSRNHTIYC